MNRKQRIIYETEQKMLLDSLPVCPACGGNHRIVGGCPRCAGIGRVISVPDDIYKKRHIRKIQQCLDRDNYDRRTNARNQANGSGNAPSKNVSTNVPIHAAHRVRAK